MSSRRSQKSNGGKKSALELLKRSRKGERNIREFDSSNSAFYEEVDEADYDNVRKEFNDFVEDDDGSGYVDNGQIETNYYSDEEPEVKVKKPNTSTKDKVTPAQPAVKPEHTLPQMFKRSTATSYGANFSSKRPQPITKVKPEDAGDDILNSILNQMDTRKAAPSTSKFSTSLGSSSSGIRSNSNQNLSRPQASSSIGQSSSIRSNVTNNQSTTQRPSTSNNLQTEVKEEILDPVLLFSDTEDTNDISQHLEDTHLDTNEPTTFTSNNQKDLKLSTNGANDAMEVDEPTSIKEKPQWMQIQQSMINIKLEEGEENNPIEEELWDDQLTSKEGELIMYWIDAVEHSGVVYIFGKTYNSETKQFTSCSVKVDNLHRCLHFLPRGGKFKTDDDDDDEEEEAEKESDKEEGDESGMEDDRSNHSNGEGKQKKEELFTYEDLRSEVMEIYSKHNITGRKGFRKASKKYAFEDKSVPLEAEYLYTVYPFDMPALPTNLEGKYFSKVFGANTSALELLLIQQKLMGPGWIKISNCEISELQVTYCTQEYTAHGYKSIKPLADEELEPLKDRLPPLKIVGMTIKTIINPETKTNEISMAHLIYYNQADISKDIQVESLTHENLSLIRQIPGTVVTDTVCQKLKGDGIDARVCTNEQMLLNALMAWITQKDPDVFCGHNLIEFGLDVLLTRLKALNIKMWSKIGRLRRTNWPKGVGEGGSVTRGIVSGRLLCDTYLGAKDTVKSKNYTLATLSESQLGITKETIEYERIMEYYETSEQLIHLVKQGDFDSFLTVKLMFKLQLLPLSLQLTNLAGNLWTRTLTGGKAERNEYLLLHEFYNRGYIVPDKQWNSKKLIRQENNETESIEVATSNTTSGRRKPAYEGGLVLEPKKGLYDKITLLLDFNSLYPSIIQEFNICFTTVERPSDSNSLPEVPNQDLEQGILPQLLSFLVERRRNVKQMMKDPKLPKEKQNQLNIRQLALKLTANSMYGCLGFTFSRFYAKSLAMLITSRGREILQNTVQTAKEEGLDVIYGDTDSIMIYTGLENNQEAHKIGAIFKQKINQKYKLLELDTDGIYNKMLLLRKKKYAALIKDSDKPGSSYTIETKGLDMVRRDWCELSRNMSKYVLDLLLGGEDQDLSLAKIHTYLTEMGNQIKLGKVPIEQFIVDKGLTKNPELYGDASIHPHVQVALQLKKRGIIVKPGDTVPYVICDTQNTNLVNNDSTKSNSGYASRAFHPEEVVNNPSLKLDYNWYLANQIHPPLARLFEPIEGTDEAHIAECLGLDPNRYRGNNSNNQQISLISSALQSLTSDSERFLNMPKLTLECSNNHEVFNIEQLITHKDGAPILAVECPHPECKWMPRPETLAYKLEHILRAELRKLNDLWVRCDDSSCGYRSRSISVRNTHQGLGRGCPRPNCEGRLFLENSPSRFYSTLAYFDKVFNEQEQILNIRDKLTNRESLSEKESFASLYRLKAKEVLKVYGDRNQRRFVNLGEIFKYSGGDTSTNNGIGENSTKVY